MIHLFRSLLCSPLRFFGFISLLLSIYFGLLFFLDSFVVRFGIASLSFLVSSVLLYSIAIIIKDQNPTQNFMMSVLGSPAKAVAFLLISFGYVSLFYQISFIHLHIPSVLTPMLVGICFYTINHLLKGKKVFVFFQIFALIASVSALLLLKLKQDAQTSFIFPKEAQNEAIIVYGIEGYPPLPNSFFWKINIQLPQNGLLITSSTLDDLPGYNKNYLDENGDLLQMHNLFVMDICRENNALIHAQYFTPKGYYPYIPFDQSDLQREYQKLYDSICSGQLKSKYTETRDPQYIRQKPRDELYLEFLENGKQ